MTKEEIIGGLKNALARGESLEKAKQSFVNAGYSQDEVNEAASYLSGDNLVGSNIFKKSTIFSEDIAALSPIPSPSKPAEQFKQLPTAAKPEKKKDIIRPVLIGIAVIIFLLIINLIRQILGIPLPFLG